ncbi:MAG: primosomal protein N' [Firmicutes bacterium]|nr:primosomal protein N' [Bacillota bacterium]
MAAERPGGTAGHFFTSLRETTVDLTPKQAQVVSFLAARPERAATRSEILAACGVGRGVLDRLVANGCLVPEERIVRRVPLERRTTVATSLFTLTPGQAAAVAWIRGRMGKGGAMLLHGVTGSGKTEVYLQAIALALTAGRTGLFLVPEIGLTPQTVERVVARFGEQVAVIHSRLGPGERYDEWERIKAGEARVVVGPRSALFVPLPDPGVVILDEEHDHSYKQEDGVRYHARTVAAELARRTGAVFIMGSATPSLEAMAAYERGEVVYFPLPERPGGRALPRVELVDLREALRQRHLGALSRRLRAALADCLAAGEQAILLLNRRGYATFVLCRECGHALRCPHCDVSLTYHRGATALLCHYCGYSRPVPDTCPKCRGRYIRYFGLGTERLCEEVAALFPRARVARMDQDATARKGAHQELYRAMLTGEIDILVGTQMVAKGLDLPRVTLVGVVAADASLNRPDFRAAERTFQLLTQVAGRAGRGEIPGRVIFQTYNPEHYSIACAVDHDYHRFYRQERAVREAAEYPPFVELVRLGMSGREEGPLWRAAEELAGRLRSVLAPAKILGPAAALVKKVEDRYRLHILIKTPSVMEVGPVLREEVARFRAGRRGTDFSLVLDVDPGTVL